MKNTQILAAVLLAVGATTAQAAGYVGFDVGYGKVDQESSAGEIARALANATGNTVTYTYEQSAPAGRIFAGWNIAKDMAVELGYLKTASLDATFNGTTTGRAAYSVTTGMEAKGFDAALVWYPIENVFIKGGVHAMDVDATLTATVTSASATYTVSKSGTGLLFGVGYESEISKTLSGQVAYTHYNKVGGMSDATIDLVTAGLKMKF
ncbi:MAG: hypothetical protein D4R70_02455 [Betaproteobacteria bacterium]|nr:MAG: hypothetical protein D4R70_02455 [Betaproteobacteria bacterium]